MHSLSKLKLEYQFYDSSVFSVKIKIDGAG